ncbi:hypothetical protein CSOJ01_08478 [Colletotrichum sojae]|uniref:F-box domain-containing protein n=1 Tax=Colletotrichum sojae TaxID=2175907 RepID=A0A8H6MS40_9PEZI|nr:hypothetical protein CSOJ01_08478 [Colletotrichum sojae]
MASPTALSSLGSVPNEVLLNIIQLLNAHDLSRLSLASKRLNALSQPLLWNDIELHAAGYHECSAELKDPPPFRSPSERFYQGTRRNDVIEKAKKLFEMLAKVNTKDPERAREILARVRHLCTVVDSPFVADTLIQLLPHFQNLKTLELHGTYSCCESEATSEPPYPALPNLRFVKLFGYMPRALVRLVLQSGTALERLELGALDRPVSSSSCYREKMQYPPRPEDKLGVDSDGESDYGSVGQECVIPRPLGGFLHLEEEAELALPALKHLYLFQPTGRAIDLGVLNYGWSQRAVRSCLADWRRVLEASSRSLETLVVEQRQGADYEELDGWASADFLRRNDDGSGNEALMEMLTHLFGDEAAFPVLKRVFLRGITVCESTGNRPSATFPGGRFMLLAERRGIACDARLGEWLLFDRDSGCEYCAEWSASQYGEESEDDDEEEQGEDEETSDTLLARV